MCPIWSLAQPKHLSCCPYGECWASSQLLLISCAVIALRSCLTTRSRLMVANFRYAFVTACKLFGTNELFESVAELFNKDIAPIDLAKGITEPKADASTGRWQHNVTACLPREVIKHDNFPVHPSMLCDSIRKSPTRPNQSHGCLTDPEEGNPCAKQMKCHMDSHNDSPYAIVMFAGREAS